MQTAQRLLGTPNPMTAFEVRVPVACRACFFGPGLRAPLCVCQEGNSSLFSFPPDAAVTDSGNSSPIPLPPGSMSEADEVSNPNYEKQVLSI
ncbi:hypothetical protein EYF80_043209 [Liparis tanakae]|uniref:Uncharacterized protein n=1 Tax=Liparis tanakae TaxID=230148 RepID=A0A4Z2G093_9TELE|nr:hypothetical protein EYF80_043209 [Liparis tanakae]